MNLTTHKDHVYGCLRCGFCFDLPAAGGYQVCPPYRTYGFESFGARGKLAIARALIDGDLEHDSDLARCVFACTECGACEAQCFKYLPLGDMFRAMKTDLADSGLLPEGLQKLAFQVDEVGNPYGKPPESRHEWVPGTARIGKRAEVLLFPGCTPAYVRRGIARGAYQTLDALGIEFGLLEDEICCGHPYMALGLEARARQAAERNLAAIARTGAETVVFPCPGCLRMFRQDVPHLVGRPISFTALHVTEFVASEIGRRSVRFRRQSRVVTYHDPCNLGRGLGVYDAPRRTIASIPGTRLVELPRSGQAAFCCGHGGFVRTEHSTVATESAADRWTEAVGTGAEVVVSACPACVTAFLEARFTTGSPVEAVDVVELLARAL